MEENTAKTPEEQVQTPPQQVPAEQASTQPVDWKARYDGQVRKLEQLTLANRELQAQLDQKSSEIEQLKAQLGIKDTEKQVAVGECDKRLQETLKLNSELQAELDKLRALKAQVEVAKEIGHFEILRLSDSLPAVTDKEVLKTVMSDFIGFAEEQVKRREQQLMAGITAPAGVNAAPSAPSSKKGWEEHINSLPLGSKERQKALDDYGDWLFKQHSKQ